MRYVADLYACHREKSVFRLHSPLVNCISIQIAFNLFSKILIFECLLILSCVHNILYLHQKTVDDSQL